MIERIFLSLVMVVLIASTAYAVPGASEVSRGNAAYLKGDFKLAADNYEAAAFKAPEDPRVEYDLGAAAYKNGRYTDAVDFFNKALLADNEKLLMDVRYNLANSLYKSGIGKEDKDIKGAIKDVEASLTHYDKILPAGGGKDDDVRQNRAYVASELERLKKKLQEQKQQDQKKQDQKDQQNQQNQQDDHSGQRSEAKDQDKGKGQEEQKPAEDKQPETQQKPEQQKKTEDQKVTEDQKPTAGQSDQGKLLSQDEANMLLDDFSQNEQPKGMLNFFREPHQERPILKDW